MQTFPVRTTAHSQMVEITAQVQAVVSAGGVQAGTCLVYVPHTTAGVTIQENADPDVVSDLLASLERLVSWQGPYRHAEGNAAAHLKAALLGASCTIPIHAGRLVLGTWQAVYFCEFDGPRRRQVHVQIMAG